MFLPIFACLAIFLMVLAVVWGHFLPSERGSLLGLILGFVVYVLFVGGMLIYASLH